MYRLDGSRWWEATHGHMPFPLKVARGRRASWSKGGRGRSRSRQKLMTELERFHRYPSRSAPAGLRAVMTEADGTTHSHSKTCLAMAPCVSLAKQQCFASDNRSSQASAVKAKCVCVKSRHRVTSTLCPLFPSKRTCVVCSLAECHKETSGCWSASVWFFMRLPQRLGKSIPPRR